MHLYNIRRYILFQNTITHIGYRLQLRSTIDVGCGTLNYIAVNMAFIQCTMSQIFNNDQITEIKIVNMPI